MGICKLCKMSFKLPSSGSTSTLRRHAIKVHPKEFEAADTDENKKQQTIEKVISKLDPYPINHRIRIYYNNRLVFLIVKDMQPFNVVEREGFRILVAGFDPRYQLPTRKTLRNVLVPRVSEIISFLQCLH